MNYLKFLTAFFLITCFNVLAQNADSTVENDSPKLSENVASAKKDSMAAPTLQNPLSPKEERIQKIYRNLEYNTTAFNDLKKTWVITDPIYVREIFNRFVVKNALRLHGVKPSTEIIEKKAKDIYDGNVFIELKKRYYDNEIEELRFLTESKLESQDSSDFFFDPYTDFVFIRDVLGRNMYEDIKHQFYALNDLTKTYYDNKQAYNFDIFLHFFEPEIMFWKTTTNEKNKYLLSFIGRWGNDFIGFPGWFYTDYVAGLKLTYIDYLINNRPNNTYSFELGTGFPARQPLFGNESHDVAKEFYHTGANFYIRGSGNILKLFWKNSYDLDFYFQGLFSFTEYTVKDFGIPYITQFYSNRNNMTFLVRKKELLPITDFTALGVGLGFSTFDVYHYLLDPDLTNLTELNPSSNSRFKKNIVGEVFFTGEAGLLNHYVSLITVHNMTDSYGLIGTRMFFMLTNTLGFDFRFFTSYKFTSAALPFYRNSSYLVFSPVIRINY